jgi:hypothetical protein
MDEIGHMSDHLLRRPNDSIWLLASACPQVAERASPRWKHRQHGPHVVRRPVEQWRERQVAVCGPNRFDWAFLTLQHRGPARTTFTHPVAEDGDDLSRSAGARLTLELRSQPVLGTTFQSEEHARMRLPSSTPFSGVRTNVPRFFHILKGQRAVVDAADHGTRAGITWGNQMKKLVSLLAVAALGAGFAATAQAHVSVGVGIGVPVYGAPPVYYAPPPVYYAPPPVYHGYGYWPGYYRGYYGRPLGWHHPYRRW